MIQNTFKITVSTIFTETEKEAIAQASVSLANADKTNSIGYFPEFNNIEFQKTKDSGNPGKTDFVTFDIDLEMRGERSIKMFMCSLKKQNCIISVERENNVISD
jgi:hypothetical protein